MTNPFGLIGLAVMGQNLVLNVESRGFGVSVFNRSAAVTEAFVSAHPGKRLFGAATLAEFVASLARPRKVMLMVKAGAAVDAVIEQLLPLLEPGDIVIDGGNRAGRAPGHCGAGRLGGAAAVCAAAGPDVDRCQTELDLFGDEQVFGAEHAAVDHLERLLWAVFVLSLPALAAALWAVRGLAPTRPRATGLAAGLLADAAGAAGYALACVEPSTLFIAISYTLGIGLCGALGAALGPRVLRW